MGVNLASASAHGHNTLPAMDVLLADGTLQVPGPFGTNRPGGVAKD